MREFISRPRRGKRAGFSLVEVALSISLFSFGFIALVPLLALGMTSARQGKDERLTAQIAQVLVEQARQTQLATTPTYFDFEGEPCTSAQAAYTAQPAYTPVQISGADPSPSSSLQRLTLRVTPRGAPDHARTYAVVLPALP